MGFQRFFEGDTDKLAVVVAFDPGGTTGWCALGVQPEALWGNGEWESQQNTAPLWANVCHAEYGQIDCDPPGMGLAQMHNGHPGLSLSGEITGVKQMVNLASVIFPKAAVVLEDFIVDFKQITSERSALSPVRLISAFSYGISENDIDDGSSLSRIHIQNRSLAKTTCTDTRLRHWGLHDSGGGKHARDATRHAYYFLRDCQGPSMKAAEKRWRAWPHLFRDPVIREIQQQYPATKPKKVGERI